MEPQPLIAVHDVEASSRWYQTLLDSAVDRARALGATILEGPRVNERANQRECWLRDPNGYVVVLASATMP